MLDSIQNSAEVQMMDTEALISELAAIQSFDGDRMDSLLEGSEEIAFQQGSVIFEELALKRRPWPVRRNGEGSTGFSPVTGPTRVSSMWHFGWSRGIHNVFPAPPTHAPVIWGHHAFFTDEDFALLIAVDRQGGYAWSDRSFRYETEPVVGADGTVYAGAYLERSSGQPVGFLVALDGATGQRKWAAMTSERFAYHSALDVSRTGRVVGVLRSLQNVEGELYSIDPVSGSEWRRGGKLPNGWPLIWPEAQALAYEDRIYTWSMIPANGAGNTLYFSAFEEQTGNHVGTAPPLSVNGLPVPNGGLAMCPPAQGLGARLVFTLGPYADMLCFQDARLLHAPHMIRLSHMLGRDIYIEHAPAIHPGGDIYLVGNDGVLGPGANFVTNTLLALDAAGSLMWERPLASPATAAPIVDGQGNIYVGTRQAVQCFDAGGHELFRVGLQLTCGGSLSLDENGQLYFQDGGILCAIA